MKAFATSLGNYALVRQPPNLRWASQRCEVPEAKLNDIVEKEPHWWERWQENLRSIESHCRRP
jgi:hypothetical protein